MFCSQFTWSMHADTQTPEDRLFLPHIAGILSRWSTQYRSFNFSLWSLFFFGVLRFRSHSSLFHMRPWDGAMCKPALTDGGNWEKGFFEDLGLVPLQDSLAPNRRWAVNNFPISDTYSFCILSLVNLADISPPISLKSFGQRCVHARISVNSLHRKIVQILKLRGMLSIYFA